MDDDVIKIEGQHYIRATSARADERTRVLKHDDTFGVFDRFGDVRTVGLTAGASAPESLVNRIIDALGGLGPVDVEERTTTTESVQFRVPLEVRAK